MKDTKEIRQYLLQLVKNLPGNPGVYLMKDSDNNIIYIGKAKNLKNRVKSYFSGNKELKTSYLVKKIADIEIISTTTEYEALILENNLIKKWKPRYNIDLKDGKSFPVIKISNEEFPCIYRTRRIINDGSSYFGPFPGIKSIDLYLELVNRKYKIRKCRGKLKKREAPCLYYHIGQCSSPCTGAADPSEYRKEVEEAEKILTGDVNSLIEEFQQKMEKASDALEFEKAAEYRDLINSVNSINEEQLVEDFDNEKRDYISFVSEDHYCAFTVLQMRGGKLSGKSAYISEINGKNDEVMTSFIIQYYSRYFEENFHAKEGLPDRITVNILPENTLLKKFFSERDSDLVPNLPEEKRDAALIRMGEENGKLELIKKKKASEYKKPLRELKKALSLPSLPKRIEGFDIAQLGGTHTVASMVSFLNGKPDKTEYRYFHIKSLPENSIDDYGSIREAVARRYTRVLNDNLIKPDLILIDGGKGQVAAAHGILEALGMEDIPLAGIAKQHEWIYLPGESDPVIFGETSPGRHLLQYVRDEAHRFATSFNKNLRKKDVKFAALESIPGIGPTRSIKLMNTFKSIDNIKKAKPYEIKEKTGIPLAAAENLIRYLNKKS